MRITAAIALLGLLLLGSCGQWVSVEPWIEGGNAVSPAESEVSGKRRKTHVTVKVVGAGPEIRPGSLVEVKVEGRILPNENSVPGARSESSASVWFWVGTSIEPDAQLLYLGSGGLRSAFVGIREGSTVLVTFGSDELNDSWVLPKRAFTLNYTGDLRNTAGSDSSFERFGQNAEYTFTILKACEARLLRRHGVLTQWGWVPTFSSEVTYPFVRQGRLEWAAIEADCKTTNEKLRFAKGPAYPRDGRLDPSWPESYKRAGWVQWWL